MPYSHLPFFNLLVRINYTVRVIVGIYNTNLMAKKNKAS